MPQLSGLPLEVWKASSLYLLMLLSLLVPASAQKTSLHYLQGGLIDLRYGQASVDTGGSGIILQWNDGTRFTLNGTRCGAEDLTSRLAEGIPLTVATAFNPADGLMKNCDALSSLAVPAVELRLEPWQPIMTPGSKLRVSLSRAEARRLNLTSPRLFIPGTDPAPAFRPLPNGSYRCDVIIKEGWNWKAVPLFVRTQDDRVFRGKAISVSSSKPEIGAVAPTVASSHLGLIPGFFELAGDPMFVDFRSVRIFAPEGVEIVQVFPRPDRVDFTMRTIGPGSYSLRVEVADLLGRKVSKNWTFFVR